MEAIEENAQETTDVSTLDDAALAQQLAETPDASSKADNTPPADEKKGEVKKEVEKPTEAAPPAEGQITVDKADWEKLQKRTKEQESFIGRQSTEIGKLRQQATEKLAKLEKEFTDGTVDMIGNPLEGARKVNEYNKVEADIEAYERQEQVMLHKETVLAQIPDFEKSLTDIGEVLKADGFEDSVIEDFKRNPFIEPPALLVSLAKRASMSKAYKNAQAEIEVLKKKPEEVVRKIENAMKETKTMTASSGAATQVKAVVSEDQISQMSDADLADILKNNS